MEFLQASLSPAGCCGLLTAVVLLCSCDPVDLRQPEEPAVVEDDEPTPDPDPEPEPGPPAVVWPELDHLDDVVELARGDTPVWATLTLVQDDEGGPAFASYDYDQTGELLDFWPASVIKIYTVTAALMLLEDYGLSLDAQATFYRRVDDTEDWTEDITLSFREMIFDVFDHSSNPDYTLLLRFAGVDWLSTELFVEPTGFTGTALMVDYTNSRPWRYELDEQQRIVLHEGELSVERLHTWSGALHDDDVGCAFRYGSRANCSSTSDMAEHMRRLMFHEFLPAEEQFGVDPEALDWVRFGDQDTHVMSPESSSWASGIRRVLPEAGYFHKAGRVGSFALDLHYVEDTSSGLRFVGAVATESTTTDAYQKVSEELTRMLLTPQSYVHLDFLVDHVNPVSADLWIHSEGPGRVELVVKDSAGDGLSPEGWEVLPGSARAVEAGSGWHSLQSDCLDLDGQQHIRARFVPEDGGLQASSDLHYVIVDGDLPCD